MNKEFKTLIAPYLFEGKTFAPTLLTLVVGWPKIKVSDYMKYENLDCEGLGFVSYTDSSLVITLGGNYFHQCCKLVIADVDGKLIVESCEYAIAEPHITHEQMEEMFVGIEITKRGGPPKSKWAWEMEINKALKNEDYEKAAELRDQMEGL